MKRYLIVSLLVLALAVSCSHIQSPIKFGTEPAKILTKASASSVGYLIGQKYPAESKIALVAVDVLLGDTAPLQSILNKLIEELRDVVVDDNYLMLQCEQLLEDLGIEIDAEEMVEIEEGNELVEIAVDSFIDGLRASQGGN